MNPTDVGFLVRSYTKTTNVVVFKISKRNYHIRLMLTAAAIEKRRYIIEYALNEI